MYLSVTKHFYIAGERNDLEETKNEYAQYVSIRNYRINSLISYDSLHVGSVFTRNLPNVLKVAFQTVIKN